MKKLDASSIRDRLSRAFGAPIESFHLPGPPYEGSAIEKLAVLRFRSRIPAGTMLVTCGASAVEMVDGRRAECVVLLGSDASREAIAAVGLMMSLFAVFPERERIAVPPGSIVEIGAVLHGVSEMEAVLVIPSEGAVEELETVLHAMAEDGKEAIGSMGDDTPPAVLSDRYRPLSHYFRQNFSQVTNPPIDSLREHRVMSLKTRFSNLKNVLDQDNSQTEILQLESPFVSNARFARMVEHFGEAAVEVGEKRVGRHAHQDLDWDGEHRAFAARAQQPERDGTFDARSRGASVHRIVRRERQRDMRQREHVARPLQIQTLVDRRRRTRCDVARGDLQRIRSGVGDDRDSVGPRSALEHPRHQAQV